MPRPFARLWGSPVVSWSYLVVAVASVVYAGWTFSDAWLIRGCELAVLTLCRFLVRGQTRGFLIALLGLGVTMPLIAQTTSPIFYYGPEVDIWFGRGWDEMAILGGLLGVPLVVAALWGLRRYRRRTGAGDRVGGRWLLRLDIALEVVVWMIAASLSTGEWNGLTVLASVIGALGIAILVGVLLKIRLELGIGGLGTVMMFIGLACLVIVGVLLPLSGGRMSGEEALVGLAPAALLLLFGFGMRAGWPPPDDKR
jgi:hypothetical protein